MDGRLAQAIASIKTGDKQSATRLLAALLQEDPRNVAAWLWMSAALTEPERQRYCLEKALSIDPGNELARAGLDRLNGGLSNLFPPSAYDAPTIPIPIKNLPITTPTQPVTVIEIPIGPEIEVVENPPEPPDLTPQPSPAQPDVELAETPEEALEPAPTQATTETALESPDEPHSEKPEQQGIAAEPAPVSQVADFETPGELDEQDLEEEEDAGPILAASSSLPTVPLRKVPAEDVPPQPAAYTRSDYVITIGWLSPYRGADRVVLLEPEALIVANPDYEYISLIRQQLVVGPVPHQLLGLSPRTIPLAGIEWVRASTRGRRMHLRYHANGREHTALIRFSNRDDCNDTFNALQSRLDGGYARKDQQLSRALIALALLGLLAGIAAFTTLMLHSGGSSALGVAAGALLALAVLIWLGPLLVSPPLNLTLERTTRRMDENEPTPQR